MSLQRHTPLRRTSTLKRSPLFRRSRLKPVSAKRAKASRIYSVKRRAFLEAHPFCQWWVNYFGQTHGFTEADIEGGVVELKNSGALGKAGWQVKVPRSVEIHHKAGRTGPNFLDEKTWMAVSRQGHDFIHQNPKLSRALGYITT